MKSRQEIYTFKSDIVMGWDWWLHGTTYPKESIFIWKSCPINLKSMCIRTAESPDIWTLHYRLSSSSPTWQWLCWKVKKKKKHETDEFFFFLLLLFPPCVRCDYKVWEPVRPKTQICQCKKRHNWATPHLLYSQIGWVWWLCIILSFVLSISFFIYEASGRATG